MASNLSMFNLGCYSIAAHGEQGQANFMSVLADLFGAASASGARSAMGLLGERKTTDAWPVNSIG
jgi:hypothetical protein